MWSRAGNLTATCTCKPSTCGLVRERPQAAVHRANILVSKESVPWFHFSCAKHLLILRAWSLETTCHLYTNYWRIERACLSLTLADTGRPNWRPDSQKKKEVNFLTILNKLERILFIILSVCVTHVIMLNSSESLMSWTLEICIPVNGGALRILQNHAEFSDLSWHTKPWKLSCIRVLKNHLRKLSWYIKVKKLSTKGPAESLGEIVLIIIQSHQNV